MTRMDRIRPWTSTADHKDGTAAAAAVAGDSLGADGGVDGDGDEGCKIPRSALLRVLQGVGVATKTSVDSAESVIRLISPRRIRGRSDASDTHAHYNDHDPDHEHDITAALSLCDWRAAIISDLSEEMDSQQLANLALGVAFLRQKCRQAQVATVAAVNPADLALVWRLIGGALSSSLLTQPLCSVFRSAQGFLAVPLCSLVKDGSIEELFRLHVWLPDGQRGDPDFAIHSHQSFWPKLDTGW